jgi:histidinol-phosphate aminotransferase
MAHHATQPLERPGLGPARHGHPFWLARPPLPARLLELRLRQLRSAGLKLRDASSFGLPGWVRVSTQSPDAQAALALVWHDSRWKGEEGEGA